MKKGVLACSVSENKHNKCRTIQYGRIVRNVVGENVVGVGVSALGGGRGDRAGRITGGAEDEGGGFDHSPAGGDGNGDHDVDVVVVVGKVNGERSRGGGLACRA